MNSQDILMAENRRTVLQLLSMLSSFVTTFLSLLPSSYFSLGDSTLSTCVEISWTISPRSSVYYPGSNGYTRDISHFCPSNSEKAVCAVEPGTAMDVSRTLTILGERRTPFAVKSGGHTSNTGFSSSSDVQISMSRLSSIRYQPETNTVEVGPGATWQMVYEALEPYNVSVVGGRAGSVGVGGLTLGGGYGWQSSQYGLTADTVLAYELVVPTGEVLQVTSTSHPDLFFALKGGMNNFGLVTKFIFRAIPQTKIYGGNILFMPGQTAAFIEATSRFSSSNEDPKAQILSFFVYTQGMLMTSAYLFYDAPNAPEGIFDSFLAIPSLANSVKTQSMADLVRDFAEPYRAPRWAWHTQPLIEHSVPVLEQIANQTQFWGEDCVSRGCLIVGVAVEPFHPNLWLHAQAGAYPHRSQRFPLCLAFTWAESAYDIYFTDALKSFANTVRDQAVTDGQKLDSGSGGNVRYPNYALGDTPVEEIWGENLDRLREIKKVFDPYNTMGLAGGFKL